MRRRIIKFRVFHKLLEEIYNIHTLHWDQKGNIIGGYFHDELNTEIAFSIENVKILQFIGRHDKDRVEIYEDDILQHHGIVTWNDVEYKWSAIDLNWNDRREWHDIDYLTLPFEVIGNIHENPELLNKR